MLCERLSPSTPGSFLQPVLLCHLLSHSLPQQWSHRRCSLARPQVIPHCRANWLLCLALLGSERSQVGPQSLGSPSLGLDGDN